MEINDKRYQVDITFYDLKVGTVFGTRNNSVIYMKTDQYAIAANQSINAVSLNTGMHTWFYDDDVVVPLNAELTITF